MDRFYYTVKQKLFILDLVRTGQLLRLFEQFPKVTQKQISDWQTKEDQMRSMTSEKQAIKYTVHTGPSLKYQELYQFLYQRVKEFRIEREAITVERLISIALEAEESIAELSDKGKKSFIRRFMDYFKLSIREITGTRGFREEQATEEEKEEIGTFKRDLMRIIVNQRIPKENIFNMDQTGIQYDNPPSRTIDFMGSKEVSVLSKLGQMKKLTLFSLINAKGELFPQMAIFKGTRDARVHEEVLEYED